MTALEFGLAANDEERGPYPTDAAELIAAKCRGLLHGYDARWRESAYVPVNVERLVTSIFVNPETRASSRTFSLAGKIDVLASHHGRTVLVDHKTTSQEIADPASPFWRQLTVEGQVNHYLLLLWLNGEKCDEAMWDVMRKPAISPKAITKTDCKAILASQRDGKYPYFDRWVTIEKPATWDQRETLEMYEARLAHDCTFERPDWYFQRRTIPRLDAEIIEYAHELWNHGQEIIHTRATKRHDRNSGACMLYGAPCKFLGICSGHDRPDSANWQPKATVHGELPELDSGNGGRDILTNSRIRCFQTCRRKHFYQYELGIERIDEEEREALLFGHIWHRALEAWWNYFLPSESKGN
jgi:hypothetical protein